MNVIAVEVNEWDKGADGIVKVSNVTFDDGSKAPGYDLPPGIEVGKPLPEGWEIATSKAGKPYIKVPKPGGKGGFGGGPAAFRNTKEGFLLEQDSIHRSVALQQAIALVAPVTLSAHATLDAATIIGAANDFYEWLRKPAGVVPAMGMGQAPAVSQDHTQANVGKQPPVSSGGQGLLGKVAPKPSGACEHTNATGFKPPDFTDPLPKGFLYCPDCQTTFKGGQ